MTNPSPPRILNRPYFVGRTFDGLVIKINGTEVDLLLKLLDPIMECIPKSAKDDNTPNTLARLYDKLAMSEVIMSEGKAK